MKQFGSFSDAIRHGSTLRPQTRMALALNGRTCAIGAAGEALGYDAEDLVSIGAEAILKRFPYMLTTYARCPLGCNTAYRYLGAIVAHLNDSHFWTRERTADWLQSEEDKLGFVTISVTEESEATLNLKAELSELGEMLQEVSV